MNTNPEKRLVGIKEFMIFTGLGRNRAMEFGARIGCKVKIGGRSLYDLKKAGHYLDVLSGTD